MLNYLFEMLANAYLNVFALPKYLLINGFIAFSIKIVMRGTSACEVPIVRDFRAIALAL